MNPSDEDINKRIAELMEWVKPEGFYQYYEIPKDFILKDPIEIPSQFGRGIPTESLDSLIPVLEQHLKGTTMYMVPTRTKDGIVWEAGCLHLDIKYEDKKLSRALSLAIYQVLGER